VYCDGNGSAHSCVYFTIQLWLHVSRYENRMEGGTVVKETLLDESDDVWCSLRHQHIAVASQSVHYVLLC